MEKPRKRLVVEYVSAVVSPPAGQSSRLNSLRTTLGGTFVYHQVRATQTGVFNESVVAESLRLYADAATVVSFCAARDASAGTMKVLVGISGYFVDVQ